MHSSFCHLFKKSTSKDNESRGLRLGGPPHFKKILLWSSLKPKQLEEIAGRMTRWKDWKEQANGSHPHSSTHNHHLRIQYLGPSYLIVLMQPHWPTFHPLCFWATLCVSLARTTFMSCTDRHHLSPSPHLSSCPSSSLPLLPSRAEKFGRGSQVFPMKPSSESKSGSGSQMKSGGFWTSQSESGLTSRDDEELASANLRNLSKLILPPLGVSGYNQTQINNSGRIISPMDSRYRWTSSSSSLILLEHGERISACALCLNSELWTYGVFLGFLLTRNCITRPSGLSSDCWRSGQRSMERRTCSLLPPS